MRKILAITSAILLALLITGGILTFQKGDFTKEGFYKVMQDLFSVQREEELPLLPQVTEIPEEVVENLSYDEHIAKGDSYFERGFLTFASNEYVRAVNLEPERTQAYLKLLKTHFELRNYSKALKNAEIILSLDPNDLETQFNVIRLHIKLSEFDEAKRLIDIYPLLNPPDARVLYYKGLLSALFGEHDAAKKSLKEASVNAQDAALADQIQIILDAYKEYDFTQAAEPLYLSELLARAFNKVEEYEMAIHLLKEILKTRSDLRDGWILFGFAYLNLEKYQFALTAFDKAYSLDSEWPTTQYFLGITHKELGHFDDAIVYFNFALNNDFEPQVVLYRHLADLYFETQDYEKAAAAYEKILESSTGDVNAFIRPVWLYIDFVDSPQKAKKLADTAVSTFPDSAMSYNLLGWSYLGLGELKTAEKNLKKALEMDPNLAAAYYNIGQVYEKQTKEDFALDAYQKAYDLDKSGSIGNMAASAYNELLRSSLSN